MKQSSQVSLLKISNVANTQAYWNRGVEILRLPLYPFVGALLIIN